MTATVANSKKELPHDAEKLRSYSWELTLAYQHLTEKYKKLLHSHYGRSSEKHINTEELDALQIEMEELLNHALEVEQQNQDAEEELNSRGFDY